MCAIIIVLPTRRRRCRRPFEITILALLSMTIASHLITTTFAIKQLHGRRVGGIFPIRRARRRPLLLSQFPDVCRRWRLSVEFNIGLWPGFRLHTSFKSGRPLGILPLDVVFASFDRCLPNTKKSVDFLSGVSYYHLNILLHLHFPLHLLHYYTYFTFNT